MMSPSNERRSASTWVLVGVGMRPLWARRRMAAPGAACAAAPGAACAAAPGAARGPGGRLAAPPTRVGPSVLRSDGERPGTALPGRRELHRPAFAEGRGQLVRARRIRALLEQVPGRLAAGPLRDDGA